MNTNLIQVLWVEDDPDNIQFYPIEASRYGLELVPFSCWEEAEKALVSDFKRWSAIILDAKCKYKKDDHDNAQRFWYMHYHPLQKFVQNKSELSHGSYSQEVVRRNSTT